MRRTIIYVLAFTGLIAIAAVLMVTSRKSTILQRNINFVLSEPSRVDRIVISHKTTRLILEKEGDRWRLNDTYLARTGTVNMFLRAMGRIEVLSPASKSITDTLIRRIETCGTQVKLYQGRNKIISLSVYYEKGLIPGTYMVNERFRKPFRVGLTGYEGKDVAELFNPYVSLWKDNLLFDFRPEEIALITMEYPQHPEQSFVLTAKPGQPPLIDPFRKPTTPDHIDQQEITDYLSYFRDVHYFFSDSNLVSSAVPKEPFAILTITDKYRHVFSMKAFRITGREGTTFNVHYYKAVVTGDSLFVVVKYSDTDPIMRPYSDFIKK